jgi:RNA polymerase sigma-70 factor, ECF subfamily
MANTRTNEEWLEELRASGAKQEAALADLRNLLLRTVLFFFSHNLRDFERLARDEILQLAEDCAQDALIAVMSHLSDFRGDSKFTTWVYKFGVNIALMAARRERWRGVSLDQLPFAVDGALAAWVLRDKSAELTPDLSIMQSEIREMIREVIEQELTAKQRRVLILMVFNEVPMDEVARQLDTNRNAIYKMLHDARRKLKNRLQARGFDIGEILAIFSVQR